MWNELTYDRRGFLGLAAKTIAITQFGLFASEASASAFEGDLPSLHAATRWLNSRPLTSTDLRGRVVVVDFWTYTCINWRRTLPYIRAWEKKYKDHGLVVIGVHTPEFSFEKDIDNVRRAADAMKIDYPIAMGSSYGVWRAFDNEYWPALYFADSQGHVRFHKFGEGDYEQLERALQKLLVKAGADGFDREPVSVEPTGAEAAADWDNLRSSENYLGYEQTENFASAGGLKPDKSRSYFSPQGLRLNHWALEGDWRAEKHAVVLNAANGRIAYQFHARDLHLVMAPAGRGLPIKFRVLLDGRPPGSGHGVDVDEEGGGVLNEPRMYQLIRQPNAIADRQFEIEFLDPGAEAFSFTFG